MRNLVILLSCILLSAICNGQSTDQNYIKSTEYLSDSDLNKTKVNIQYFDGLGRSMQNISVKQSVNQKDIVQPIIYDEFGRQAKDYLPYPTIQSNGSFVSDASLGSEQYYQIKHGSSVSYSEKEFEDSPLNRVLKQAAPGDGWRLGSGHEIEFNYQANTSNEVILFKANVDINNNTIQLLKTGNYQPNQLYKTITKDENHTTGKDYTIEEFKNKHGQIVLKRTYNSGVEHNTYYVYDIYGNLTYVLPPLINTNTVISQDAINKLGYQYKYDERNRLIEKKLPSKSWEYMVYDKQNRLVATQDGNMRSKDPNINPFGQTNKVWHFIKYDNFSRVVYTGYYKNNDNRSIIQDHADYRNKNNEQRGTNFNASGLSINYSKNGAFPYGNYDCKILTVNYYDDYNFPENIPIPNQVEGQIIIDDQPKESNHYVTTIGLATASFIRILDSNTYEKSIIFYDQKARPVRIYEQNYLGGYTQVDSKLDFRGKVLKSVTSHKKAQESKEIIIVDTFNYDHAERLTKSTQKIDNKQEEMISYNVYDDLGQLKHKNVGGKEINGNQGLQQIDYKYNIRGWLTDINNTNQLQEENQLEDQFAFKINYQEGFDASQQDVEALYNGNITQTSWRTNTDNQLRYYTYSYDALNRLKKAYYGKNNSYKKNFDEHLEYDKNGNITQIERWDTRDGAVAPALADMDALAYEYYAGSNLLKSVSDATGSIKGFKDGASQNIEYQYDANGNMVSDANKNITQIQYNHLNLPKEITWANGNKITYLYNAAGVKKSKDVKIASIVDRTLYMGSYQYKNDKLVFIQQAEGYINTIQKDDNFYYNYVYNYLDHLGNIRLSYTDSNLDGIIQNYTHPKSGKYVREILEENNYYPFGLKHPKYNSSIRKYKMFISEPRPIAVAREEINYKYKYNGKELQDELGLDWYDYGARNYDASLGRWMNIDPLAENGREWSTYNYALNNPIYFIDPDGMWVKGAGFWRNMTSSDARIHAENFASESEGTVVKGGKGFSVFYSTDNSSNKAFFPNEDSKATPSIIASVSALEARNPNGHGVLIVDMFELLGMTGVGVVQAGIESTGVDSDDAAILSSILVTVYDLKGLKVNKVINNVDDLLEAAGKFSKGKTKVGENTIVGNVDEIFETVTKGGVPTKGEAIKMPDGRYIHKHNSTRRGGQNTITVDKAGKRQMKIKIGNQ